MNMKYLQHYPDNVNLNRGGLRRRRRRHKPTAALKIFYLKGGIF